MAMVMQHTAPINRAPRPSSLADVLDLILDKGLVIDAYVRVSVIGIEILVIDARIVVASVDTYLRFAEAVNRLDLTQTKEATTYRELVEGGTKKASEGGTEGVIEGVKNEFGKDKQEKDAKPSTAPDGEPSTAAKGGGGDDQEKDRRRSGNGNGDSKEDKGFMGRLADRARHS